MRWVDALDEGLVVIAGLTLIVEHFVEAGLIDGYGVERGHDAHILQLGLGGMPVAVAIDRHVVHDVNIDDVAVEIVVNGLCRCSHRLEEEVLRRTCSKVLRAPGGLGVCSLARGVDIAFACR